MNCRTILFISGSALPALPLLLPLQFYVLFDAYSVLSIGMAVSSFDSIDINLVDGCDVG